MNNTSEQKLFPLQARDVSSTTGLQQPIQIPWEHAEEAYEEYKARYGADQSLERLAERGGFGAEEIVRLLCWRIQRLKGRAR